MEDHPESDEAATRPRYICIHGHFYQPPRENPWLESIELQDSAYPYHDWNERINDECYAPNGAARHLDAEGKVVRIENNYARISYNFGPTLLAWLEANDPETYQAIIAADAASRERFGGHGSAMAQAYNHMILPLADERDRRTQILWGLADFRKRFGREAEGMWLPETAADTQTLELLAEYGLRFTLLAPRQAKATRRKGEDEWRDAGEDGVDPSTAYEVALPSGRSIAVFFYDGPISQGIAFEGLLNSSESLAHRLSGAFTDHRDWPQLVHIATDGETYGHHHRNGEMALSYALEYLEREGLAQLTNYAQYLNLHPPEFEAQIHDNSSWSCVHGVERWRADCGCHSGMHGHWHQAWRAPLREALDWLRDELRPFYEQAAGELFRDPWATRDAYIEVILDRSEENVARFLQEQSGRDLTEYETVRALELLEIQRHLMLMYTSCGWFFDELSGIETVQCIQYAGRALQLAEDRFGWDEGEGFLERLAQAPSNLPEHGDGRRIFEKFVRPAMVNLRRVSAHFAASGFFDPEGFSSRRVYSFAIRVEEIESIESGRTRFAAGRLQVQSEITRRSARFDFGVLHFGDQNLNAGIREAGDQEDDLAGMRAEIDTVFRGGDLAAAIRWMDGVFGDSSYTLRSLFRDQQRAIIRGIMGATFEEIEGMMRQTRDSHMSVISYLAELGHPLPTVIRSLNEAANNAELRALFQNGRVPDSARVLALIRESERLDLHLDLPGIALEFDHILQRINARLRAPDFGPDEPEEPATSAEADVFPAAPASPDPLQSDRTLAEALAAVELIHASGIPVDLWKTQNAYFAALQRVAPAAYARKNEEARVAEWLAEFERLGELLHFRIPGAE